MPKRGENIRKRKDGRWEARILTEKGKYKSIYAKSYYTLKSKISNEKNGISEHKQQLSVTISFEQLCSEWIKEKEIKNKQSTIARYTEIIKKHILPYFENMNIEKIERNHINAFVRFKTYQGNLNAKTVQDITCVLIQILKYAEKQSYIKEHSYDISRPQTTIKELEILTSQEQKILINYIKREINQENIGILLSLYTGLRLGEVCALQWQDIDIHEGIIYITKTMQRISTNDNTEKYKTKVIIDTPKSQKSHRRIPIPDFLLLELKKLSKQCSQKAYILTGSESKYTEPRTYQYKFKKYLKNAGIRDINYHALRHTFATRAVEQNIDIKTLSEILGHSTVSFTLDRYVHPSISLKKHNMEKLAVCY